MFFEKLVDIMAGKEFETKLGTRIPV